MSHTLEEIDEVCVVGSKRNRTIVSEEYWIIAAVVIGSRVYRVSDSKEVACQSDRKVLTFIDRANLSDCCHKNCCIRAIRHGETLYGCINVNVRVFAVRNTKVLATTALLILAHDALR